MQLPCPRHIGPVRWHITLSPRRPAQRDGNAGHAHERVHHLAHRDRLTGPEVDVDQAGVQGQVPQRSHMTLGQILDMDVVAQRGAVRRGVVIAIDLQQFAPPGGDLADAGHQVGRNAAQVLANLSALMCTDRFEVVKRRDTQRWATRASMGQQGFTQGLAHAVGVHRHQRSPLAHRIGHRLQAGKVHQRMHAMFAHGLAHPLGVQRHPVPVATSDRCTRAAGAAQRDGHC